MRSEDGAAQSFAAGLSSFPGVVDVKPEKDRVRIYADRAEGLLKISSQPLEGALATMVQAEEENQRVYRAGFERSASEPFGGGTLTGMRLSFYTTEGPRQLAHTIYFLQDKNTVYVLRFMGKRGVLDRNRNLSDQVARSFQPLAQ